MNTNTATEYRNLPLAVLTESTTNPRRIFEDSALKELADFVPGHKSGVLCPCPFCDPGRQKAHGCECSPFCGAHNEKRFKLNLSLGHAHNSSFQPAQRSEIHRTAVLAANTSSSLDKKFHT